MPQRLQERVIVSFVSNILYAVSADRVQVYYRVYADDLPVVLAKPIFFNDPFLGRIQAASVTPPHTAANIKHYLCKVEGINGHARTDLFSATSNESPTGDNEHLSILENDGPGSKPSEPMGLIVKSSDLEAKSPSRMTGLMGLARPRKHAETRYRMSSFTFYLLYSTNHHQQSIIGFIQLMARLVPSSR